MTASDNADDSDGEDELSQQLKLQHLDEDGTGELPVPASPSKPRVVVQV